MNFYKDKFTFDKLTISRIQNILVFLYIITLSFLRIGFNIYYYKICLADFILGLFIITIIYDLVVYKTKPSKKLYPFLIIYGIFF